ncbi:MAG: ElyC/SanA/YdcF family protein [Candidatus Omnitrophota bacterium]
MRVMIKNENIICISSIDWDFVWQGHQEIMSTFAKNGNRVLFIENTGVRAPGLSDISRLRTRLKNWLRSVKGFRQESENLFVYSPLIAPFPYSRIARWINKYLLIKPLKKWMKASGFHDPIIWTFLPTGTAIDIVDSIESKFLVYYCIADFNKLVNAPKKVNKAEDELIRKSDLIFAQGEALKERCERINPNVHIFPFGVKMESFEHFRSNPDRSPALDIENLKRPIIGYVGGVHRHIDFGLIRFVAERNPGWTIVLVGPIQTDISEIAATKNIFLVGKKEFNVLPHYIHAFDVCIIPYEINDYTKTVFPTKLNEYHAMGKPVVSTNLPEVVSFNLKNSNVVLIAKAKEEFNNKLADALQTETSEAKEMRIASARANDWSLRIAEMSDLIKAKLKTKKIEKTINWKDDFLKLYKQSKKRLIFTLAGLAAIYFILFYTPFVWFVATPLKISETPQKADAIVVFAGGVGESGRAGQGYEERVGYAVNLFKEGYAEHLIFLSGYTYAFKEPLVMRALAVSLGVPKDAIILEDKARNTEQNVRFSKAILKRNGWGKILLVSSPYHMRRALLVFKKSAEEIEVVYAPILDSMFYARPSKYMEGMKIRRQVNFRQLKGILHEYLAIAYYWFKGYI